MSLSYLIDGYNVINHIRLPGLRKDKKDPRHGLLEFINTKRLCGSSKNKVTVVFDGFPKTNSGNNDRFGINVLFSQEESADALIKRMLDKAIGPRNIIVVSDDREIKFFARSAGAQVKGVEAFAGLLDKTGHKKGKKADQGDFPDPVLSYSDIARIDKELREKWLRR